VGQKVNPIGFRVGVYRGWDSRWFARDSYGQQLMEDFHIRKYLETMLENAEIARIEIEKPGDSVRIVIFTARPGVVIGKKGQEIEALKKELAQKLKKQNIEISVQEVKQPELDAQLVAKNIAAQLERRASYKKAMKRAAASAMRAGVKGIKICCSGRLHGAEIARKEGIRIGSIPLHTLRSDVDYGFAQAYTTYGVIGVKVWICKGEFQRAMS
jgi:small subunit ribosomal protein S3